MGVTPVRPAAILSVANGARGLVGEHHGQWTLLKPMGKSHRWSWLAKCDCGAERIVRLFHIRNGNSKGCGDCGTKATHGMSRTRTYRSWDHMKQRCLNPNNGRWTDYGGAGIKLHYPWLKFEAFFKDMGPRPEGMSLDRVDPFGNYEPTNCRWATPTEQMHNLRSQQ